MRNPTREEEGCGSTSQVLRLEGHRPGMVRLAEVIERHHDHHEPAQGVDGTHPGFWGHACSLAATEAAIVRTWERIARGRRHRLPHH